MRRMTSMEDVVVAEKKHPVGDLLDEILGACRQIDSRKELLEHVKALIRAKQNVILTATSDHWQKKYDLEQKEKSMLAKKYRSLKQAFDLLSSRSQDLQQVVPSFDALPPQTPTKERDRSRSFVSSGLKKSGFSAFKLSIEQGEESEASRTGLERSSGLRDSKTCPLCHQQLHPVYAELGEKEERVEVLSDIIASMNKKGRELMSLNNQLSSEITRLKQEAQGVLEALKSMELQTVRMIQEHTKVKREFVDEIEQKRKENEDLKVKVSELESKVEYYHTEYYLGSPRVTANRRNSLPLKDGLGRHGKQSNLLHMPTLEIDESEAQSNNESPPSLLTPKNCMAKVVRGSEETIRVKKTDDKSALISSHNETNSTDPNDRRLLKPHRVPSEAGPGGQSRAHATAKTASPAKQPTPKKSGTSSKKNKKSSFQPRDESSEKKDKHPKRDQLSDPPAPLSSPRGEPLKKNLKIHPRDGYGCALI